MDNASLIQQRPRQSRDGSSIQDNADYANILLGDADVLLGSAKRGNPLMGWSSYYNMLEGESFAC